MSVEDDLLMTDSAADRKRYELEFPCKGTSRWAAFNWVGEWKAGLLKEDEKDSLKWQKLGAGLDALWRRQGCEDIDRIFGTLPPSFQEEDDDDEVPLFP